MWGSLNKIERLVVCKLSMTITVIKNWKWWADSRLLFDIRKNNIESIRKVNKWKLEWMCISHAEFEVYISLVWQPIIRLETY